MSDSATPPVASAAVHPQSSVMQEYIRTIQPIFESVLARMVLEHPRDPHAFLANYFNQLKAPDSAAVSSDAALQEAASVIAQKSVADLSANILQSVVSSSGIPGDVPKGGTNSAAQTRHSKVGLKDVPEALLLSLANAWLCDSDAAALARVDCSLLRNLRNYHLKTVISVAQAVHLSGYDITEENIERLFQRDQQSETEVEPEAAAADAKIMEEITADLKEKLGLASATSSSSSSESNISSGGVCKKASASLSHRFSFGVPERVYIDTKLDAVSVQFLPRLRPVREVILGRHVELYPARPKDRAQQLSLDYLAQYLPPSLTRLAKDTASYNSLSLSVSSLKALENIVLPTYLTELVISSFPLSSATILLSDSGFRSTYLSPEHLSIPIGLKVLDLETAPGPAWEKIHNLYLPQSLRSLRIRTRVLPDEEDPTVPIEEWVLPSQLEELHVHAYGIMFGSSSVLPKQPVRFPDSLLKLTIKDVGTFKALRLPPRLQSLTLLDAYSNEPLRLADLHPLPATLTSLRMPRSNLSPQVDLTDLILPGGLQVLEVYDSSQSESVPDLQPICKSLTELGQLEPFKNQWGSLQAVRDFRLPYVDEPTEVPPNVTRLHVEHYYSLPHVRFPDSLKELHTEQTDGFYGETHPLQDIKTWPPQLELVNYMNAASSRKGLPLHVWSPPHTITSLTFATWPIDLSLHEVHWPSQLVHLSIGRVHAGSEQNFKDTFIPLPEGATRRAFLAPPAKKPSNWPVTLTSLHLLNGYSEAMAEGYLPPNLRELHLSIDWNARPVDTYFPPTLTSLVFGTPGVKSHLGNRGGSLLAQPLVDLLAALPDGLKELRAYYDKPLQPAFHFSPATIQAVGEQLMHTIQAKMDSKLRLPASLRQLHLQSHGHLADGWEIALADRPNCATFFADSKVEYRYRDYE